MLISVYKIDNYGCANCMVMEETAYLATSSAPFPPIVLSHNLDTLWNNLDHTACNHPLIHILGYTLIYCGLLCTASCRSSKTGKSSPVF